MAAMTLLVDRREAELSLTSNGRVVCLRYLSGEEFKIGINGLQRIVVQGETDFSTSLLRALNAAGVSVLLLPTRGKGEGVHLFPTSGRSLTLKIAQYRAFVDPVSRLALAKLFVIEKLRLQMKHLEKQGLTHSLTGSRSQAQQAVDLAELMGVEGSVARLYFEQWRTLWQDAWGFKSRNRRPPRDPVNALLSLGYTLTGHSIGQQLATRGLELGIGFLHSPHRGRPSLALDVLETVRPLVDDWLWQQVNTGLLTPKDFSTDAETGCRLNKEGRGKFYGTWFDEAENFLRPAIRQGLAILLNALRHYRLKDENPIDE